MTHPLQSLSHGLADAIERAAPSIVAVRMGKRRATGVMVDADHVVTTAHVLVRKGDGDRGVTIHNEHGGHTARVVGVDPALDLALLAVSDGVASSAGLQAARWAPLDELRVGNLAVIVGRPDRRVQAALGMVSALGAHWLTPRGAPVERWIDMDGPLPPGFSGGALVAADASIIGMNTRALVRGGTTLDHGTITRAVQRLLRISYTQDHQAPFHSGRGYLGVAVKAVPQTVLGPDATSGGLLVTGVRPGSPAATAGIMVGDVVTHIGHKPTPDLLALTWEVHDQVGQQIEVTIRRGGEPKRLQVTISSRSRGRC